MPHISYNLHFSTNANTLLTSTYLLVILVKGETVLQGAFPFSFHTHSNHFLPPPAAWLLADTVLFTIFICPPPAAPSVLPSVETENYYIGPRDCSLNPDFLYLYLP